MKALTVGGPLQGFAWARLAVSLVLLALAPFVPPGLMAGESQILAAALIIALTSSSAMLLLGPPSQPRRLAWFICLLDATLITAVVAATGGELDAELLHVHGRLLRCPHHDATHGVEKYIAVECETGFGEFARMGNVRREVRVEKGAWF